MTEYIVTISATVKRATTPADHGIDHGPNGAGEWASSQTIYHKNIVWILRGPQPASPDFESLHAGAWQQDP